MGGGHDTLYLSDLVPEGKVYAFDIQPLALERTRKRLEEAGGRPKVQLSWTAMRNSTSMSQGSLMQACSIWATCPLPTMWSPPRRKPPWQRYPRALERVKVGGTVVVVVYPGHPEGKREGELLLEFASSLSDRKYDATYYRLVNIPDCPFILAFQKRQ